MTRDTTKVSDCGDPNRSLNLEGILGLPDGPARPATRKATRVVVTGGHLPSHPLDLTTVCPKCGQRCFQRYDFEQVGVDAEGRLCAARHYTCASCHDTYARDLEYGAFTEDDLLRILDRREWKRARARVGTVVGLAPVRPGDAPKPSIAPGSGRPPLPFSSRYAGEVSS